MKNTPDQPTNLRHCMVVYADYPLGETRVQREAEALLKHGYEVDVICLRLKGKPAKDAYKGVKIYRQRYRLPFMQTNNNSITEKFLKYLLFFFTAATRVTWLHLQKSYTTIQVHNLPDFLVFCTLIPKWMGVPVILDLHDLMPEFFASRVKQNDSYGARLIRKQEHLACRFADHVITVSEHWRQKLIERGVPAKKCSVVMNVADDQIFYPAVGQRPSTQPHDGFRLIYHGSIHKRYGLDLAVEAVARLQRDIPGISLSLVGNGPYLSTIQELIQFLNIQEHVHIEPLHLAEELPDIIRSFDLGVVPYRSDIFTDGLVPTKLMEYAALEIPSIAARTPTIQAYFEGTNTEFFEPGNLDDLVQGIRMLYNNPERRKALAAGSRNFTQRYNWTKIGAEYVALVDQLGMRGKSTPLNVPAFGAKADK